MTNLGIKTTLRTWVTVSTSLLATNNSFSEHSSASGEVAIKTSPMLLGPVKIVNPLPTGTLPMTNASDTLMHLQEGSGLNQIGTTIVIVILSFLVIFALIGNITLVTTIVLVRKLHSKTHLLLVDLAISDIILAITVVPIDIDKLVRDGFHYNVAICEFTNTMFFMSLPASALSLSLLTLERYITLKYPLTRLKILTKKRAVGALVFKWFYVIIIASLPAMGWVYAPSSVGYHCNFYFTLQYSILMVAANFLLPLLIILLANIEIFRIANCAARKHRHSVHQPERRRASFVAVVANVKAAKRIMLLVGLFLISWLPYIANIIVNISCGGCSPQFVTWIMMVLNYSNATMNPILYGLLNKEIRHELKKMLTQVSMKCTNTHIDQPFLGESRTECMFSKSAINERENKETAIENKDTVNETLF